MTREIKFRGKDILTDKWVYGNLLHLGNAYAIVTSYEEEELEVNPISDRLEIRVEDIVGVYPETVGQLTEQLDKNGKEVYEGDVIIEKLRRARKDGERLVICFDDFEWNGKNANGTTTSLSLLVEYHTIEVIGNIHDNPELLKTEAL